MTTVAERPVRSTAPPPHGSPFAGTGMLLRLYLRRDRIVLPLWVLLLSLPLSTVYVASIRSLYATPALRQGLVDSIMASPAQRAMYGVIHNASLGATGLWKAGPFHTMIAIAVILTLVRHTRAEEENGRGELVASTRVGRYANLTAALLLCGGASLATGLIGAAGLLTTDVATAGSIAFGLALAGSGLVFTAVTAVAAQLSAGARTARGIAFAVLATAFALRAVGDAGSGALSWASPLGWSLEVRPYAGERWWVLLLHLAATAGLTVLAFRLLARRDVGAGLLPDRLGPAVASARLRGPLALAWRLQRGLLLAWLVGLSLYALLIGSVIDGIAATLGDDARIIEIVTRMGGSRALQDAFVTMAFTVVAVAVACYGVSATLRLHTEEAGQRAEATLAGAVSRVRWMAGHAGLAVLGCALLMLVAGVVTGLVYGAMTGDVGGQLPRVVAAALVTLPAVWMLPAVTAALVGSAPRFAPAAWAVLAACVVLLLLGASSGLPAWVADLQPFGHTPKLPAASLSVAPLLWMLLVDAVLFVGGALAMKRRDLRS